MSESRPIPDFFIVGHHKSGTTALYQMLRQHPDVFMSPLKEPRYLASDLRTSPQPGEETQYPQTLDEYLALFRAAKPGQRIGEASATYLFSRTAAGCIDELQPQARIIAVLREPASFIRSLHLTYLKIHFEHEKDLRKAISLEQGRREGKHLVSSQRRAYARSRASHAPGLLQYTEQVRYVEQLERYRARFPEDRMLVLIYDDYRDDNEKTLRTVHQFLDIEDVGLPAPVRANVTADAGSERTDELLQGISHGRGIAPRLARRALGAVTTRSARRRATRALRRVTARSQPTVDDQLMTELRCLFKPEVEALSEYLGRDLVALWGYDALDCRSLANAF